MQYEFAFYSFIHFQSFFFVNQKMGTLEDMDFPDIFEETIKDDMDIGISLFSYDLSIKKPDMPKISSFHLQKPDMPNVSSIHFQKPPTLHRPTPPPPKQEKNTSHITFEMANNPNPTFVLDTKKEAEAKALVQEVDNNMGEFAILMGALANSYRGMVTTAPAGLFGNETVEEAKGSDKDMERAILNTSQDSSGLWRQILEGFAKYGEAEGDPTLAKLKRRMEDPDHPAVASTRAQRRLDRTIQKEEDAYHEGSWKKLSRYIGNDSGLNPVNLLGKKIMPALMAIRPPPRMITVALNHLPRMTTPEGVLDMIRSYVGKYIQLTDSSRFFLDAIMRVISPILFPLLRFIARDSAHALHDANRVLQNKKIAMVAVAGTTYLFRLIGWIWHMVVAIVHTVVRLIAAIIQFVVAIIVSIYASPIVGIIINAVVALVIKFIVR